MRIVRAGYLPLSGGTLTGDLNIGAHKLKTTNLLLKEGAASYFHIRNADDDAFRSVYLAALALTDNIDFMTSAKYIAAISANNGYLALRAWDTDNALVEIARLVGTADPYFQATLPMVLKPATTPGATVEGMFGYHSTSDKLWFQNASVAQQVASNVLGMFALLIFGTSLAVSDLTVYLVPGFEDGTPITSLGLQAQCIVPCAGVIGDLYAEVTTTPGSSQSVAFTVQLNGADQSLTCTIANPAVTANDTAHPITVAAGDKISIKTVCTDTSNMGIGIACLSFK